MVFGLFEGSIELRANNTTVNCGEAFTGKLVLKLKKPKKARQLRVRLIAVQTQRATGVAIIGTGSMGAKSTKQENIIYSVDAVLDGEKEYMPPGGEYEFRVQAPARSSLPAELGGTLGTAIKAVQMLSGTQSYTKWYLEASLDIPGGMDISKRMQVSVQ